MYTADDNNDDNDNVDSLVLDTDYCLSYLDFNKFN